MPELAEVEFYRKRWDVGLKHQILAVKLHAQVRDFRGTDCGQLRKLLPGTRLLESAGSGKQMLFGFSRQLWLSVHLGMTGKLSVEAPGYRPGRHDHLVLYQKRHALVFRDARQFGRVQFHSAKPPDWWVKRAPNLADRKFDLAHVTQFLARHRRLSIKATLLLQAGFPGIGNWMADEVLWQAGIAPRTLAGDLSSVSIRRLWTSLRQVGRTAMRTIGKDFSDPPAGWLFHERWSRRGKCPVHQTPLKLATIGGRTTAWCERCQPRAK